MKKIIAMGTIFIFLFGSSFSLQASSINMGIEHDNMRLPVTPTPLNNGKTLYVGGSGPNNYSKIQDAIDNASSGDTVFVYDDSAPYYETLTINKTINLIGENQETTIISGQGKYKELITIQAENCLIKGFNIQNTKNCGIGINFSSGCEITENIIFNCSHGIGFAKSKYCIVSENHFIQCTFNNIIFFDGSNYCTVTGNIFEIGGALSAIYSDASSYNNFTYNLIKYCNLGMLFHDSHNWNITYNTFKYNIVGIILSYSWDNVVSCNNFHLNIFKNALFMGRESKNKWSDNYWNRPRLFPKIIRGWGWTNDDYPIPYPILSLWNIDWRPAQEPYDIPGGGTNIDVQIQTCQNSQQSPTSSITRSSKTTMMHTGTIAVTVKHAILKTPLNDACVIAYNLDTEEWYYVHPDENEIGVHINNNLPVGDYFIGAGKEGYTIDVATVTIKEGEQTTYALYIKPGDGNPAVESETIASMEVSVNQQSNNI